MLLLVLLMMLIGGCCWLAFDCWFLVVDVCRWSFGSEMTVATKLQIHEKKNSSSKLVRQCKVSASLTNVDTDTGESTHTHMYAKTDGVWNYRTDVCACAWWKNVNLPYATKHNIGTRLSKDSSSWCSLWLICCKKLNVASDIIHARVGKMSTTELKLRQVILSSQFM